MADYVTGFQTASGIKKYDYHSLANLPESGSDITNTVISPNADYAEVGEWADGNPDRENRLGYFVAIAEVGDNTIKIRKATSTDDIRGVSVYNPAFSGNASRDKYGEDGELLPQYNYIGLMGIVNIIDEGRCTVGGRCMSNDDGIAIPSTNNMGYAVLERVDNRHILIAVEPGADMIQRIKRDIKDLEKYGGTVDKIKQIDTEYGDISNVSKTHFGGIRWENEFRIKYGDDLECTGPVYQEIPLTAGKNITFDIIDNDSPPATVKVSAKNTVADISYFEPFYSIDRIDKPGKSGVTIVGTSYFSVPDPSNSNLVDDHEFTTGYKLPIAAGDNVTFTVDEENQVVKINATSGGSSTGDEKLSYVTVPTGYGEKLETIRSAIETATGDQETLCFVQLTGYYTDTLIIRFAYRGYYHVTCLHITSLKLIDEHVYSGISNISIGDFLNNTPIPTSVPYQSKTDDRLATDDKSIVGAINELNDKINATGGSGGGSIEYSEGLAYNEWDDGLTVVGIGTCVDRNVLIPPEHDGLPVISIGDFALYATDIDSIYIPASITGGMYEALPSGITVYCEAEEQPDGWYPDWNTNGNTVIWGYKLEGTGESSGGGSGFEMPQIRFANFESATTTMQLYENYPFTFTVEIVGGGALQEGDLLQICVRRKYLYKGKGSKWKLRKVVQREITSEDIGKRFLTITVSLEDVVNHGNWLFRNDRKARPDGSVDTLSYMYFRIKRVTNYYDGDECDAIFSNVEKVAKTYHYDFNKLNIK